MDRKKKTINQAILQLETLCARAEHCTSEVQQKMYNWGFSCDDMEKVIIHLKKNRYIDDARFARAYVKDKLIFSRWGRQKIIQGLIAKRVSKDAIEDALDEIYEQQYMEILEHVLKVKSQGIANADSYEGKIKLLRFAVSRGFELSLAKNILDSGVLWEQ